jgi:Rho GDP-dissociation inhibitor
MEEMLGSFGPNTNKEPYTKNFEPEETPSGMLARSGQYHVRSQVIDDDKNVYAGMFQGNDFRSQQANARRISDFEWWFKIAKEW